MNITPINCRQVDVMIRYKEFNFFSSIQDWRNAFEKFKTENGHYPSAPEIDITPYLPTSRTIQRRFPGGLRELRKEIGLNGDEIDYRTGELRSSLCSKLNEQSIASEDDLYYLLSKKFGPEKIHRQEPYTDKIKNLTRSDMGIYINNRHFYIDIFVPYNSKSLYGCVGAKLRKFKKYDIKPDVYLVIGNKEMNETWINHYNQFNIKRLIERLPSHIKLITYEKLMDLINKDFVV